MHIIFQKCVDNFEKKQQKNNTNKQKQRKKQNKTKQKKQPNKQKHANFMVWLWKCTIPME